MNPRKKAKRKCSRTASYEVNGLDSPPRQFVVVNLDHSLNTLLRRGYDGPFVCLLLLPDLVASIFLYAANQSVWMDS